MKQKNVLYIVALIIISVSTAMSLFNFNQKSHAEKIRKPVVTDITSQQTDSPKIQLNKTIKNGKPTLLLFTSEYCHDCKLLKPVIKKIEKDYKDKVNFLMFDIQAKDPLSKQAFKQFKIFGVPVVVITDKKGNQLKPLMGFHEESKFKKELDALLKK